MPVTKRSRGPGFVSMRILTSPAPVSACHACPRQIIEHAVTAERIEKGRVATSALRLVSMPVGCVLITQEEA